jgi:hypothetical protein
MLQTGSAVVSFESKSGVIQGVDASGRVREKNVQVCLEISKVHVVQLPACYVSKRFRSPTAISRWADLGVDVWMC